MLILSSFAFAVLGGLLLNVMPCVFPILSLKAMSLAKAGGSEADAKRDAVAYAAGVIAVCAGLGATIIALRAGGTQIGWAFQLQDPRVVLALVVLMTAIALNLAGLFEITLTSGSAGQGLVAKSGAAGSFWTGALAAFIATPCTGPFMAGALGAALVLPPIAGVLVFAGLGLGLSLPFLAIGFIPAMRRRMPRPGAWMATLRMWLSLPMFATVLALVWLLSREGGVITAEAGAAAALVTGLLLWGLGLYQRHSSSHTPALAVILPVGSMAIAAIAGATGNLEIVNVNWVGHSNEGANPTSNDASIGPALAVLASLTAGIALISVIDKRRPGPTDKRVGPASPTGKSRISTMSAAIRLPPSSKSEVNLSPPTAALRLCSTASSESIEQS